VLRNVLFPDPDLPAAPVSPQAPSWPPNFRFLLIFENAFDPASIAHFLRPSEVGDVVVTTTMIANWTASPQPTRPFHPVLMAKLRREDSMTLVRTGVDVLPDYEPVKSRGVDSHVSIVWLWWWFSCGCMLCF
jgi:hypothetical protein